MCGKSSKSSAPAPAPAPVPQATTVGDTSNLQQRVAATNDTSTQTFGSELGSSADGSTKPNMLVNPKLGAL